MKKIVLLGSTGNVGRQTLEIVAKYPEKLEVVALSTNGNIKLLKSQIKQFSPKVVCVANEQKAAELSKQTDTPVLSGADGLLEIANLTDYKTLVNALVGLVGIRATLQAIKNKKDIALANKEALVAAGSIIMAAVNENNVKLMPIDSEHSALYQCLNGEKKSNVKRLIITCSGGALRDKTKNELQKVTVQEALGHKTWKMGQKITIDSATLMNKGFEVLEAMWLYDIPVEKIDVVIHPQSIIHSMVEYYDGSIIAQMSEPDMKLPIQYALSYPERWQSPIKQFDFTKDLTFQPPDLERFPCLSYMIQAAQKKGTLPAAINAANDYLVSQFLQNKCRYSDISKVIKKIIDQHNLIKQPTLKDIETTIKETTEETKRILSQS